MPEYMDVHRNMKGITPEQLMEAHQKDLEVQNQENVTLILYDVVNGLAPRWSRERPGNVG